MCWLAVLTEWLPSHRVKCQYTNISMQASVHVCINVLLCTGTHTNKKQYGGNATNASGMSCNPLNLLPQLLSNRKESKVSAKSLKRM